MKNSPLLLNKGSYISLSLAFLIVGVVISVATWAMTLISSSTANTRALTTIEKRVSNIEKSYNDDVKNIKSELGTIKGQLNTIIFYTRKAK